MEIKLYTFNTDNMKELRQKAKTIILFAILMIDNALKLFYGMSICCSIFNLQFCFYNVKYTTKRPTE